MCLFLTLLQTREASYSLDPTLGCYLYYFKHRDRGLW